MGFYRAAAPTEQQMARQAEVISRVRSVLRCDTEDAETAAAAAAVADVVAANPSLGASGAKQAKAIEAEVKRLHTQFRTGVGRKQVRAAARRVASNRIGVHLLGSAANLFDSHGSDLDISAHLHGDSRSPKALVRYYRDQFERSGLFRNVSCVAGARVPLVTAVDRMTGSEIDVSFNTSAEPTLAVHNSRLLRTYAQLSPVCRPLVMCVKHWAKRRRICDAYAGTLSSYGWTLLVIHYLQRQGLLPDLQDAELVVAAAPAHSVSTRVSGWAVSYCAEPTAAAEAAAAAARAAGQAAAGEAGHRWPRSPSRVGRLLVGFFEYFASFDWGR
jgi:hypothetical protein